MSYPRITAEEAARFNADGFLIKPAFFDAEEAKLMARALIEDEGIGDSANNMAILDGQGHTTDTILWTEPGDDLFGAIARCARMVEGVELALGGEVYHYHSKLTLKAPRTGGAWNWHQDYGYWYFNGNLFPHMLSVMIAISESDRENGCLKVLKGSHHMGRLDHMLVEGQTTADPERVEHALGVLDVVEGELAPGDALFLHCNTLHGSSQNRSDRNRNVLLCCYNAARNNPYMEHHFPRYTPIDKLPDAEVKARGRVHAGGARRFMHPADHPADQVSLTAKSKVKLGA
jgi:ectoine hydroxylase